MALHSRYGPTQAVHTIYIRREPLRLCSGHGRRQRSSLRRSSWKLAVGSLLLLMVGVQCFAINDNAQYRRCPKSVLVSSVFWSKREKAGFRMSQSPLTRLWAVKDEEEKSSTGVPFETTNNVTSHSGMLESLPPVKTTLSPWPCFDNLDKELIRISIPVIGNYAINPLIGAVDLFWVNRMGNALAVAGQAAANQVFSSAFWFTSFLPSGKHDSHRLPRFHSNHPFFTLH
jgi:hypothetical protein